MVGGGIQCYLFNKNESRNGERDYYEIKINIKIKIK